MRIGDPIGNYRITGEHGEGGFATVYAAEHTAMGTRHANKVLHPQFARKSKVVERFKQEARTQFRMRHPNIVQVTEFIDQDGVVALVMDFVDGMTLQQALARRPGPWPLSDVLAVMTPVLEAMAYAHQTGMDGQPVVHRDLKPENVLLDLAGDRPWPGVPKVMDFGIAKVFGDSGADTATNARMGTPGYGAPEQFRNAKEAGAQADVWALGMMFWQLCSGRLPIDPSDNLALIKLYEGLTPVPRLQAVPDQVAAAVAVALEVDAGKRFAAAGAFLTAVGQQRGQETPAATVPAGAAVVPSPAAAAPRVEREVPAGAKPVQIAAAADGEEGRSTSAPTLFREVVAWATYVFAVVFCVFVVVRLSMPPKSSAPSTAPAQAQAAKAEAALSTAVWRDPRTGLTWQTGDAGQDMYWTSAKEYCAGLALGGGNWRLPTIEELKGLVRKEQPGPPFIVAALKATTTSEQFRFYWSATAYPAGSDSVAEVIDFSSGKTYGDMRQGHRVRCVR